MRYIKFNTQVEAQEVCDRVFTAANNDGKFAQGTTAYAIPEQREYFEVPVLEGFESYFTNDELNELKQDILTSIEKGSKVILEYLKDNKVIDLSTQQSLQQLQKFSAIKALLEVGAIDAAIDLLTLAEVDEVFTQERKDKYLLMLA